MSEYIFWAFSYITLFVTFIWVQLMFIKESKAKKSENSPLITIAVPVYNEEKNVGKTITSLLNLNYPKEKLQIIAVNHGSTDNSLEILKKFENEITIIDIARTPFDTKATAVNKALKIARGEYFVEIDSDATIENRDALLYLLPHFEDEKVGTVISSIKVRDPKTIIQKIQWFEYLLTSLIRNLMANVGMLIFTHGVFCMSRTKVLREIGGFAENNFTEDLELGLKMIHHKYKVKMESMSFGKTTVPSTFMALLDQRVRWYRGFMQNIVKHKQMIFNKDYGLVGMFTLPVSLLSVAILFTSMIIIAAKLIDQMYMFVYNLILLRSDILFLWDMPALKQTLLNMNLKLMLPFAITILSMLYLFRRAHRINKETLHYPAVFASYLIFYPFIVSVHWATALYKHATDRKVRWTSIKK